MTLENAYEDRQILEQSEHLDIVRKGYLRKLKKNKRRYFVLRSFSRQGSGRLECYGSEKKFKEGNGHGRTILISEMFNFAEMSDQESSLTFAIFLKDEKYVLGAELLEDRENWLEALNFVKNQGMMQGKLPKYEFIWKIHIKDQGIARGTFLCGDRRLGKIDSTLCFLKGNSDEVIEEFQLCNVRQSGQADSFLLLEIGRSHPLGPGELWIEAQNKAAAEYMYTVLFSSSLVRPRSYVSTEVARPFSKDMTNRRRSDGADKSKPSKRSFLPFLRSKLKETEAYAEKSFQANQKRSMSAADIRRVGVNQNGDLFNKLFSAKTEQTTGSSSSISETRKDSISSKKSRRLSLFRGKKHQKSMSVQDLHKVDQREKANDTSSRCNSNVSSLLKENYDYCLSRSVQNIHTLASSSRCSSHSSSPTPSQSSGRLANIKKLSEMKSTSDIYMSRLAEKDPVSDYDGYRRVVPNGRPVTMLVNDGELTPVLRKNKWKSLDGNLKDSPAESSEDCSSVGSFESDRPQLSSKEATDATSSPLPLVDQGYMRMNYNNNDDDISNAQQLGRNSMYVLVQPDANIPKYEEIPEEYMDMSPGNKMDFERVLNVVQKSTGVSSEENVLQHSPEQERCHDDAQKISYQGAGSGQSSGSDVEKPITNSPMSPEKRGILRDFRKQMTVNWKASPKKTPEKQSPKKRYSEATSHFYVDTFPACDSEEKSVHEMENFKTGFQSCDEKKAFDSDELWSGKLNKQRDVPPRPNHLDLKSDSISDNLSTVVESSCEIRDEKSANICPIVTDDDIDLNSEIVSKHSSESKQITQLDSCLQSKKSKHQKLAFVGNNNSVVYTEVTLKEKSCAEMPGAKGARKLSNSDEQRGGSPASKKNGRKISQKILSSPTSAEGKGYENISLRDGVITTPLDEVEGRPYVNLGFHQNATGRSKKGNSGKRSSGDDAALRQLMALQSGRKMDSEVATRSKSLGDSSTDDNDSAVDNAEADYYEEVAYVNVSKENKGDYAFNHGDVARIVARNARQSATSDEGDDCTYENLYNHNHARSRKSPIVNAPDLDANTKGVENVETKQIFRQSPTSKQKSSGSDVYTNIDENYQPQKATEKLGDEVNRMKLNDDKRPIPAPRPKKNERRKPSKGIENEVGTKDLFQKTNHSPKQNYCRPGSPQKGADEPRGDTYVNVGSYRDNFDAVQPNPLASSAAKCRSYENLADEFPVRRNAKISVDWSLAYAQVEITGSAKNGKGNLKKAASFEENCEGSYADIDITKRPDNNKNSPQSDQDSSPRAKHYAYSEVDFKKSQGISEAVRGRRAESGADSSEQEG